MRLIGNSTWDSFGAPSLFDGMADGVAPLEPSTRPGWLFWPVTDPRCRPVGSPQARSAQLPRDRIRGARHDPEPTIAALRCYSGTLEQ